MTTQDSPVPADSPALPDAGALLADDWPMRIIGSIKGTRLPQYQAVIRPMALDAIHGHGKSVTSVEVCGVLVGNVYRDAMGPYLYISGTIRGDRASGHAAQVTFTAETWTEIQSVMDKDHADERIVGWYHTHPGFGVFLSGMDLFIQDHFFNLPWQVAFVYDPIGSDEGMFFWREGKADRQQFLVENEDTRAMAPTMAEVEAAESLRGPTTTEPAPEEVSHNQPPSSPQNENRWAGEPKHHNKYLIPAWFIGAIAFAISFGCTLWAMYSLQSEVVTVPHHVDHPISLQPLPAKGGK